MASMDAPFPPTATPPAEAAPASRARFPHTNYINAHYGIKSWLLTKDHKRIALLYLVSVTFFFLVGGLYATAIRLELLTPANDLFEPQTYNKLFTQHGIMMVFFFLIPAIPATLGNFLVPLMIGAKDLAFPRINLLSWYIYVAGAIITIWALLNGGVDTGWTFYTPYSTTFSNTYVTAVGIGIFINGFSSILTGLNFIVTIHTMRAPGMTWFRLPLFIWSTYATSLIMILGTPVIAITLLLVALERIAHIGIFDPRLGGDPVLFQHFFWFYSHPAVYIMILPAMGVISEVISTHSRKNVFGYTFVAFSSLAIAVFGFLVWGHHLFTSSQSVYAGMIFSIISFTVAIPSAVKVFNWTATLYRGSISYSTPMLYGMAFIGLFTIGGLTGLFLASLGTDVHLTDTYFIVAHFHYVMVGGTVTAYMAGLHNWWPKITGRMYPEGWGRFSALVVFVGFNLTFFPQFLLGTLGMPRRYAAYPADEPLWQVLNVMSTAGASILAVGLLIPGIYFIWSMRYGKFAPANPWPATGLEWRTMSPPPTENFVTTPVVTWEAYEYRPVEEMGVIGATDADNSRPVQPAHGAHTDLKS
ncbi:MAG: cbb3-type cytochrome c oxidase subunit I [Acidobacteriota bacterium]|nr:cbb3-type cytochrome c oxidase subunit I [Acidobacteriota bacterium]